MSVAEKLERLARLVPGVAGYQDKEMSRATDKTVRSRLAETLEGIKRDVEAEQRWLTEARALERLAGLGRLSAKLDKVINQVTYASRGYRGFFDTYKLTQAKLDKLYEFDLSLFGVLESLRVEVEKLRIARNEDVAFAEAVGAVDRALDSFEATFAARSEILIAE